MSRSKQLHRAASAMGVLVAMLLAGCAGLGTHAAPPFRDPSLTMPNAQTLVIPGQSRRPDVLAALGPATVVTFDSGFEVWAYRTEATRASPARAELVILFEPSGVVRKTRLRTPA